MTLVVRIVFQCAFGKFGAGQAGGLVAFEALNRAGRGRGIRFDEGGQGLLGLRPRVLVENGFEFWLKRLTVGLREVAQDGFQLMLDTALTTTGGELERQRIEHGLVAISNPQVNRLHPACFEVIEQACPGALILALPNREAQDLPFPAGRDAHRRQNSGSSALRPRRSPSRRSHRQRRRRSVPQAHAFSRRRTQPANCERPARPWRGWACCRLGSPPDRGFNLERCL